ncbi:hypothetical protein QWY85_14385 [Neolewinella lacunae]|uniref:Uncharacterized protein n=1 Tax=Neolewinella lacunae TaxID=1517758 RepID=A0A923PKT1_9BACT|nr:hypothetical protein [Neolewinella lacunae]MBC6993033.1 hypothetical protein [Neolewinella lacunae]MDN3635855.1 hypothetical protein [Neolewinella lacunae]
MRRQKEKVTLANIFFHMPQELLSTDQIAQLTSEQWIEVFLECEKHPAISSEKNAALRTAELIGADQTAVYKLRKGKNVSLAQLRKYTGRLLEQLGLQMVWLENYEIGLAKASVETKSPANAGKQRHYVYYFSGFTAGGVLRFYRSYLMIDIDHRRVVLEHYPDPSRNTDHHARYEGELLWSEDKLFMSLQKLDPITKEPGQQRSFNTINANLDTLLNRSPHLVATYTTFHPDSGVAILELADSKAAVAHKIANEAVPPWISYILYNRRVEVNRSHRTLLNFEDAKKRLKRISNVQGSYQGFVLYERANQQAEIIASPFEIYDGFRVSFKSPNREEKVVGYIATVRNGILQFRMDYSRGSHHHRAAMSLKTSYYQDHRGQVPEGTMAGTYNLITPDETSPLCGRIILYPVKAGELPREGTILVSNEDQMAEVQRQYPSLIPFLSGEYDQYCDSPLQHSHPFFRRYANRPGRGETSDPLLHAFTGQYYSLRVSSRERKVYMRPIEIDGLEGTARRIIYDNGAGRRTQLTGTISLTSQSILTLCFTEQQLIYSGKASAPTEIYRSTMLAIEERKDYRDEVLIGFTHRINKLLRPISFKEYFFRAPEGLEPSELIQDFEKGKDTFTGFPVPQELIDGMLAHPERYIFIGEMPRD